MTTIAIIPARGGSRGIPRKNLRSVCGKPLLAYTIEHAKATPSIDRVVVSTDDVEIGTVAARYGAEVIWRPGEISGDRAPSEAALLHALDELAARDGYRPDLVVMLQATSPLRRPDDTERAIATLLEEGADSLFSACRVHGFLWHRDEQGLSSVAYDYRDRRMRQDGPEDLLENGSIYVTRHDLLRATSNRLGGRIAVHRMHVLDSFQVDDPADLALMERLLASSGNGAAAHAAPGATLAREANVASAVSAMNTMNTVNATNAANAAHAVDEAVPIEGLDVDLLVLDFDGVMTDDRVLVDQDGVEAVWCHRGDGWGVARLRDAGVPIVVLSTETNPVVAARCEKLRIDVMQSCDDKLRQLRQLAGARGVAASRIAFVGNDVNDLAGLRWVGVPIAVADAAPDVRAACRYVTRRPGGHGAVREVAEWILAARSQGAREQAARDQDVRDSAAHDQAVRDQVVPVLRASASTGSAAP
jgi:YrbI family 3-deoxy-D-manno-octulosonate 8-phosphate phosphatase